MKPSKPPLYPKDSVDLADNTTNCLELRRFDNSELYHQGWEFRKPNRIKESTEYFAFVALFIARQLYKFLKECGFSIPKSVYGKITAPPSASQDPCTQNKKKDSPMHIVFKLELEQCELTEKLRLTQRSWTDKEPTVCRSFGKVTPITTLEDNIVDQLLERSLQQGNFQAIRAILNFEGYGVPLVEPNDLVIPETWNADRSGKKEVIEIEMTAEDRQLWQEMKNAPPEEITEPEPFRDTAEYKAFVERMARNIPLHLEEAIRNRNIPALRMWLRLYGKHDIAAPEAGSTLLGSRRTQDASGTPPSCDL